MQLAKKQILSIFILFLHAPLISMQQVSLPARKTENYNLGVRAVEAAEKGEMEELKECLANPVPAFHVLINHPEKGFIGSTPLQSFLGDSQLTIIRNLREYGADVNYIFNGRTALGLAFNTYIADERWKSKDRIMGLLAVGAQITPDEIIVLKKMMRLSPQELFLTPLKATRRWAGALAGKLVLGIGLQLLLPRKSFESMPTDPMYEYSPAHLIRRGKKVVDAAREIQALAEIPQNHNSMLLALSIVAAVRGCHFAGGFLAFAGFDINSQDSILRMTPLAWAAARGNVDLARQLVFYGADPYLTDAHGDTPLHHASRNGHAKMVAYLMSIGRRAIILPNENGNNPVDVAVTGEKSVEILEALASNEYEAHWTEYKPDSTKEKAVTFNRNYARSIRVNSHKILIGDTSQEDHEHEYQPDIFSLYTKELNGDAPILEKNFALEFESGDGEVQKIKILPDRGIDITDLLLSLLPS